MFGRFLRRPSPWKGLAAGVAGGLAATIVMTQFQNAWSKASKALKGDRNGEPSGKPADQQTDDQNEDATMKVAGKLAIVARKTLSLEEKKKAGPYIHYGFGTAVGALYGLAYEFTPRPVKGLHPVVAGSGYGTALFLGADEIAVPALGLSEGNGNAPLSSHLYGWASHLVYGLTLEMVRKTVRQIL